MAWGSFNNNQTKSVPVSSLQFVEGASSQLKVLEYNKGNLNSCTYLTDTGNNLKKLTGSLFIPSRSASTDDELQ